MKTYQYQGVMHIHSIYSDGTGTVPEIMRAACELCLDFVIITDHNTLKARYDGFERWYELDARFANRDAVPANSPPVRTMGLISYEANDAQNRNHYLVLDTDVPVHKNKTAREYVQAAKEVGGFGIIAHPHEKRDKDPNYPPYPWTDFEAEFDGIEVWNQMSEWIEGLTEDNKYRRFLHPLASISSPPKETLSLWDKLNQSRKVVAVGSTDAHAHDYNFFGLNVKIFPYKVMFKAIRTYVVTRTEINKHGDIAVEKKKIYDALRGGNAFIGNCYVADPRGFAFEAKTTSGREFIMGDDIPLTSNDPVLFRIATPVESTIRLIRNGNVIAESIGTELLHPIGEAGAYRTECTIGGKAWIFSNHIRIR
jgi:hypothetical protein